MRLWKVLLISCVAIFFHEFVVFTRESMDIVNIYDCQFFFRKVTQVFVSRWTNLIHIEIQSIWYTSQMWYCYSQLPYQMFFQFLYCGSLLFKRIATCIIAEFNNITFVFQYLEINTWSDNDRGVKYFQFYSKWKFLTFIFLREKITTNRNQHRCWCAFDSSGNLSILVLCK